MPVGKPAVRLWRDPGRVGAHIGTRTPPGTSSAVVWTGGVCEARRPGTHLPHGGWRHPRDAERLVGSWSGRRAVRSGGPAAVPDSDSVGPSGRPRANRPHRQSAAVPGRTPAKWATCASLPRVGSTTGCESRRKHARGGGDRLVPDVDRA